MYFFALKDDNVAFFAMDKKHPVEQKLGRMLIVWMGLICYFITTP